MEQVTGIGGVFFRSKDPAAMAEWYRAHLGVEIDDSFGGTVFSWTGGETTVWAPFGSDTEYFGTASHRQNHMVNYRVSDLAAMLAQLRDAGVEVDDNEEHSESGDFGWAVDCDGNRFELWQPPPGQ